MWCASTTACLIVAFADIDTLCDGSVVPSAARDPTLLLTRLNNVLKTYTGKMLYTVSEAGCQCIWEQARQS
jgi:hypothetical protein